MCDFVHNKYVTVIPMSPQGYGSDSISTGGLANLHIEFNDSSRTLNTGHYKATVFYLCL